VVFSQIIKKIDYKYIVNVVAIKCLSIDSDEAGSSNEFFGEISIDYSGDKFLANNVWKKSEGSAVGIRKGSESPIGKSSEFKIREDNLKGYIEVSGTLTEADEDMGFMGGDDDKLGTKTKQVNIADITSELKTYQITGFSNAGDSAEIIFTIQRVRDIKFD